MPRPIKAIARSIRLRHVLLLLILWVVASGASLAYGVYYAQKGKTEIDAAKAQFNKGSRDIPLARTHLKLASKHLGKSHRGIDNPITFPWRAIPWANTQLSSASALTGFGQRVSSASVKGFDEIDARYPGLLNNSLVKDAELTNNKADMLRNLGTITASMHKQMGSFDIGPSQDIVKPLAQARAVADKYAVPLDSGLSRASGGALGLADLLSQEKQYAFFAANTTESRSGAGMFLSAGLLHTGNNNLKLGDMESTGGLKAPQGSITWTGDIGARWGFLKNQNMVQDLMLSPRFDANAPIAADIWNKAKGTNVDGVIVVDVEFLRAVLAATGPITIEGTTFTAENVIRQLSWDQYARLEGTIDDVRRQALANPSKAQEIISNAQRRDILSELAKSAFERVSLQQWDPLTFAKEASKAADGRHFLAWSKDPTTNEHWKKAWVSGELSNNSMMVTIANFGGNKLDQFLQTQAALDQKKSGTGYDCTLTMNIKNTAPNQGPRYIMGPFGGTPFVAGQYNGFLTVNLPGDSTNIEYENKPKLMAYGHDGPTQLISTPVNLKTGESRTLVLKFHRPNSAKLTIVEPSARIPATTWKFGERSWKDDHTEFLPVVHQETPQASTGQRTEPNAQEQSPDIVDAATHVTRP